MQVRWLGWAGVEIEAEGATVVVDALEDPYATFAPLGEVAEATVLPPLSAPSAGAAAAALVTHLHRDHADAGAIGAALAPGGFVAEPPAAGGSGLEDAALAQAEAELEAGAFERRRLAPWATLTADPFTITALPAVDGAGDPQVSWLVEAEGRRVLHLGDTMFHGYWWRMALRHGPFDAAFAPINGAALDLPHRRPASPLPAAMDPEQAALAGELAGALALVPIHYGGFDLEPHYRPVEEALSRFEAAAAGRAYSTHCLEPGEALDLGARAPA